ncbi:MAG: TonB-dependent receptor plug domain-containing protein [Bacteroidetes bacterium]|jgi:hypothetical protein|nr:TonB-dependent receptor plug domain-containing protein [Bacteroidota bacterium]
MKLKKGLLALLAMVIMLNAFSQQKSEGVIEGRVFNAKNNEPVEFATVAIYGDSKGTVTDLEGKFSLKGIEPGYTQLVVSYVGFKEYISEEFLVTNAKKAYIEIPLQESNIEIEEVVVKSSPFRRSEESPVSLQRIGIAEIEKNPGGNRDISRVIQSLPGVSSSPSFRNDVIVRGGGASENRFYLDGVEIPNLNHFATQGASGGPVGIINVDFLREVNFYSSAFPADRGDALSSVLDMKQIDGNAESLKFRGSVGASDLALTFDGPIGDKTTFIGSFRRSYLQFLFDILELPFLPTYNDVQFKIKTKLNQRNEISIIGLGALDQFNLNLDADETAAQRYILSFLPVYEQSNYTIGGVYKHFADNGFHTLVLSRNYLNNVSYKYLENDPDNERILDYSSSETENKLRYERDFILNGSWKINTGFGLEQGLYDNNTMRRSFIGDTAVTIDYNSSLSIYNYSVFGKVSKSYFKDRLTTSIGLRADGSEYSDDMANPVNQLSPRASLSYALTSQYFINFNIGRYYQRPPYTSLGFENNEGELINRRNDIKYIRADHYVAGVEYRPTESSIISLEGFYKLYDDYPFSVNDSVPISSKGADFGTFGDEEVLSISEGRAYGLEVLARSRNIFNTTALLSYTLVWSEFREHDNQFRLTNQYVPTAWDNRHIINITATRSFSNGWDAGFKWRYVAGAPYTPFDLEKSRRIEAWNAQGGPYLDYSRFNEKRLDAFHQLDIRIDKAFFFSSWSLMVYLDIQNVYNFKADEPEQYALRSIVDGTPPENDIVFNEELGMNVYDLKKIEPDTQGTILPTIGIMVEF